jgi:hypothetical protein
MGAARQGHKMRTSRFGIVRKLWWLPPTYSSEQNVYGCACTRAHYVRYAWAGQFSPMSDKYMPDQGKETAAAERRDAQRYAFICAAELMELGGSARISARTTDASLQGCYIDTLNPFPVGTRVRLQLTKNDQRLQFQATVTSCHMGSGMGLIFEQPKPEQSATLRSWLHGTSSREETAFRTASQAESEAAPKANVRFAVKLLKVLERKGMLTHSEAAELLRDLGS